MNNPIQTQSELTMPVLLEAIKEQSMYLDCNRHLASEQVIDGMLAGMNWVRSCIEQDKIVELTKANPAENAPASVAPAWLLDRTHVVEYSPNCARRFMVRLCGYGKPHIDRLLVHESKDAIGFGPTLKDAAEQSLKMRSDQRIAQKEPVKPVAPSIDPGPGYRMLEPGELPKEGDEVKNGPFGEWVPSVNWSSGIGQADRMVYRRKVDQRTLDAEQDLQPSESRIADAVTVADSLPSLVAAEDIERGDMVAVKDGAVVKLPTGERVYNAVLARSEQVNNEQPGVKDTESAPERERWQAGQWLVSTSNYLSWSCLSIREGELYLVEKANEKSMTVAGMGWDSGHSQFRAAKPEEVSKKLADVYRRLEDELENASVENRTQLRTCWFGNEPVEGETERQVKVRPFIGKLSVDEIKAVGEVIAAKAGNHEVAAQKLQDGWIDHDGSKNCPVDGEAHVHVKYQDGKTLGIGGSCPAKNIAWDKVAKYRLRPIRFVSVQGFAVANTPNTQSDFVLVALDSEGRVWIQRGYCDWELTQSPKLPTQAGSN